MFVLYYFWYVCVCAQPTISCVDKVKIRNQIFSISSCLHYRLFPFPTEKKNPEKLSNWKQLLNRQELEGGGLWEPSKDSHICGRHFVDGEPTLVNPDMGYRHY